MESQVSKVFKKMTKHFRKNPLEKVAKNKNLIAYKHTGFWQCMDTVRDKEILEKNIRKFKV